VYETGDTQSLPNSGEDQIASTKRCLNKPRVTLVKSEMKTVC